VPAEPWRAAALILLCLAVAPDERVGASGYSATADLGDTVVRRVGDQEIRASDVFQLLDMASPGLTADATDELVLMVIVQQEAQREGVDVSDAVLEAEVDRTLAEQRARFAMEVRSDVTLEEFVQARHGWDAPAFREVVRRGVLGNLLLDRVVRLSTFRTTRDELQLILVTDEALAQEIAGKLADGASFSVLARNHSGHPSAPDGGFMPPLPLGVAVPLVGGRETLEPGDFLGPAPITLGDVDYWRIVRLVDRLQGDTQPWSVLGARVEADLEATNVYPDELTLFEAAVADRYAVSDPRSVP
jgi:parvulin-like peptidyl-prolyl isomerase